MTPKTKIKIIHGKSESVLPTLPDDSIDLVVTSPPYNVDLGNNKYNQFAYDMYNDNKEHHKYIEWLESIFAEIKKKVKSGGRICINIGDGKNGRVPTHADIIHFMTQRLEFIPITTIVWRKSQIGNRTSWGSWMSPSCPSYPTPFEYILIFGKNDVKLQTKGMTDLTPEEFKDWAIAEWTFAPENRQKEMGHPAMFPEELPKRLIKMNSWRGAIVLDPFSGMGTTGVVCKRLVRSYIGIEMSKKYCDKSLKRINDTRPLAEYDMFAD